MVTPTALWFFAACSGGSGAALAETGSNSTTFRVTPMCSPDDNCAVTWDDISYPPKVSDPPVASFEATGELRDTAWNNSKFQLNLTVTVPESFGPLEYDGNACGTQVIDFLFSTGRLELEFPPCPTPPGPIQLRMHFDTPVTFPSGFSVIFVLFVRTDEHVLSELQATFIGGSPIPALTLVEDDCPPNVCGPGGCPVASVGIPSRLPNPPAFTATCTSSVNENVVDPVYHVEIVISHGGQNVTFPPVNDSPACGSVSYDFGKIGQVSAQWPACPWPQERSFTVSAHVSSNVVVPRSLLGLSITFQAGLRNRGRVVLLSCISPSLYAVAEEPDSSSKVPWLPILAAVCGLLFALALLVSLLRTRHMPSREVAHPAASRYQLLRKIGSGSYGVVYLVRRRSDGAQFAMKYVDCDSAVRQDEALREFEMLRVLRGHPNMIEVVETFVNWIADDRNGSRSTSSLREGPRRDGNLTTQNDEDESSEGALCVEPHLEHRYVCLVMPYYRNGDLGSFVMGHGGPLAESMLTAICGQLCDLLAYAHTRQPPVIHRDLKPANILIDDSARRIVVTDFGLARRLDAAYCSSRAGTLAYIAPECWGHHYGTEADLWSVGCIMYAAATGRVEPGNCRVMFTDALRAGFHEDLAREMEGMGRSAGMVDLVLWLLTVDYHNRPSAQDVLRRLGSETVPSATDDPAGSVVVSENYGLPGLSADTDRLVPIGMPHGPSCSSSEY